MAWPASLLERVQAVRAVLDGQAGPTGAETLARCFFGARTDAVAEILETLAALGQIRRLDDGRYAA